MQLVATDSDAQRAFLEEIKFEVGDRCQTRFWWDPWLLIRSFKEEFLCLFNLSTQKNNYIAQIGWKKGSSWR